jgi:hypothetical protein
MTNNNYMNKLITILIFLGLSTSISTCLAKEPVGNAIKAQGGTGFRINDLRTFEVNENTVFKEDGEIIPETRAQGGTGYKIKYQAFDVNPNITQGTLAEVELINLYKGPVVLTSPVKIFNIESLISSHTYFANGITLNDIKSGDELIVSGFIDTASTAVITRIEKVESLTEWKLSGYVEELSPDQFRINGQIVNYAFSMISACETPLSDGAFVEVFADAMIGFELGDELTSTTSVKCIDRAIVPDDTSSEVIIEGMIDALDGDNFLLSGQSIEVSNSTRYIRGRAADIQEKIKVEVEGNINSELSAIIARKVRFLDARINLTLPVEPSDLSDNLFNVAGISIAVPPQVLDPEGIISNGFNEAMQLQFKGYDYGDGDLYLTRIFQRGQVDYDHVSLSGEVSVVNEPMVEVFGVSINTTDAQLFGADDQPLTAVEFFQLISIGAEIQIENATLNDLNEIIFGGEISIVNSADNTETQTASPNSTVVGIGTVTSLPDVIFNASFD